MGRLFTFVGVTTAESSIMRIFPRWRDLLGLGEDVEIVGWDLPIHAPPRRYRETVAALKGDPDNLGGLVTTHKIDLYRAAHDLFDELDEYARLLGEVSCIAKYDGRLQGWAKDPISAGRALDRLLCGGYFGRTGGWVLCFGVGGAGLAISLHLLTRPDSGDRPTHIIVIDRSEERLFNLKALHRQLGSDVPMRYVHNADAEVNDDLVGRLPPHSLVINATGMGKDLPGSPVTDAARFPQGGIAWELNYRGALDFLRQARSQRESRQVRAEDGWQYFLFGWTTVIEQVFARALSDEDLQLLGREAAFARPAVPAESGRVP